MKVLLINPPWSRLLGNVLETIPLGLCYIAGVLREKNHDVVVYNADFKKERPVSVYSVDFKGTGRWKRYKEVLNDLDKPIWREVKDKIDNFSPDIVGISVITAKYKSALNVARIVKETDPSVPVIVGGPHSSCLPEQTAKEEYIDVVVRGEGEITMADLLDAIDQGRDFKSVQGITYSKNKEIVSTPNRPLIEDLDNLPFPARDLVLEREQYPSYAFGVMFTSRGCPYHCIFCASNKIWSRKVRFRSPENVVAEIEQVHKDYGTRLFDIEDDTFTLNKKRVEKICELLVQRGLNIKWVCDTRVNLISDDLLRKMKEAGCIKLNLGIESGNPKILEVSKKGITLDEARVAVKLAKRHKIMIATYFMMGLPYETKESILDTINFMKELNPDFVNLSVATPYPGTELFDIAKNNKMIPSEPDWSEFFHQSPEMLTTSNISFEEFYELLRFAQKVFDRHNKIKLIKHPRFVIQQILEHKYQKRISALLRLLWESIRNTLP